MDLLSFPAFLSGFILLRSCKNESHHLGGPVMLHEEGSRSHTNIPSMILHFLFFLSSIIRLVFLYLPFLFLFRKTTINGGVRRDIEHTTWKKSKLPLLCCSSVRYTYLYPSPFPFVVKSPGRMSGVLPRPFSFLFLVIFFLCIFFCRHIHQEDHIEKRGA